MQNLLSEDKNFNNKIVCYCLKFLGPATESSKRHSLCLTANHKNAHTTTQTALTPSVVGVSLWVWRVLLRRSTLPMDSSVYRYTVQLLPLRAQVLKVAFHLSPALRPGTYYQFVALGPYTSKLQPSNSKTIVTTVRKTWVAVASSCEKVTR